MKKILVFITMVMFAQAIYAQYQPCEVIMKNGTKREGTAKIPDELDTRVTFKPNGAGENEKIPSKDIRTLIFKDGDKTTEMDYLYVKVNETFAIQVQWAWIILISRGAVNMYYRQDKPNVLYCHREGEKYALCVPVIGYASKMATYFEDYPELAQKIKNKAAGYGMNNISDIVAEYNAWKK